MNINLNNNIKYKLNYIINTNNNRYYAYSL